MWWVTGGNRLERHTLFFFSFPPFLLFSLHLSICCSLCGPATMRYIALFLIFGPQMMEPNNHRLSFWKPESNRSSSFWAVSLRHLIQQWWVAPWHNADHLTNLSIKGVSSTNQNGSWQWEWVPSHIFSLTILFSPPTRTQGYRKWG